MRSDRYLACSAILSIVSLSLLLAASAAGAMAFPVTTQEQFEFIYDLQAYTRNLGAATPAIRFVLFFDSLFILAYIGAICFAIIGFSGRNLPVAWFCGLGMVLLMGLDYLENILIVISLDLAEAGETVSAQVMARQVLISSMKWHAAATVLFALSFLLPGRGLAGFLLVWGTRLGMAIAVPLFVINPLDMRALGSALILLSMAAGFVLLAVVAWQNRHWQTRS